MLLLQYSGTLPYNHLFNTTTLSLQLHFHGPKVVILTGFGCIFIFLLWGENCSYKQPFQRLSKTHTKSVKKWQEIQWIELLVTVAKCVFVVTFARLAWLHLQCTQSASTVISHWEYKSFEKGKKKSHSCICEVLSLGCDACTLYVCVDVLQSKENFWCCLQLCGSIECLCSWDCN